MRKQRYALRLAYDGAAFRGFQRQPGLATVQGSVEDALSLLEPGIRVHAAARTDAGVHAVDQVLTFSAHATMEANRLRTLVNEHTPPALLCVDAARVEHRFHARASAISRTYVYLVGWPVPPQAKGYAWDLPDPRAFPAGEGSRFDLGRAGSALAAVVGEHDFGGFARPGEQTARRAHDPRATVTTVTRAFVVASADAPLAAFVIEGRGFVRAMVRNIIGTAVAIAVGAAASTRVTEILAQPAARYRGARAPGWGLTLASVSYPSSPFGRPPS
jgi:tRNA pseudouridine38-40 synthase